MLRKTVAENQPVLLRKHLRKLLWKNNRCCGNICGNCCGTRTGVAETFAEIVVEHQPVLRKHLRKLLWNNNLCCGKLCGHCCGNTACVVQLDVGLVRFFAKPHFLHLCLTNIMLARSIPRTLFAEVKHFFFHHIVRTIFPNTACTLARNTAVFPRQVRKCVHKRRCFPRTHRRLSTALSAGFPQTWLDLHSKSADVSAHTSVFPRHCPQVWPQTPHFAHNSFRPIVCKTTVHVHNSVGTNTSTANVVVCAAGQSYNATVCDNPKSLQSKNMCTADLSTTPAALPKACLRLCPQSQLWFPRTFFSRVLAGFLLNEILYFPTCYKNLRHRIFALSSKLLPAEHGLRHGFLHGQAGPA